jgi:hypothetical protein
MKSGLPFLLLASLCSFGAHSQECTNDLSPEGTLTAIQLYRDDPVGDYADCALSVVGNFAEQSPTVLVELRPVYFPWELGGIDSEAEVKFLGAFVAGNVEYQLTNKVKENRPIEGVRLQLLTYERMREVGAIETLQEFERWLDLERNGQLGTQFEN